MKKIGMILGLAALCTLLFLSLAEAARLGGGRSFGGRSTYSRSYSKPAAPTYSPTRPPAQMAQPAPAATPPLGASQPGFFSRFGMGLGGLMVGGLIGSMLFGGGMGGLGGMGGGIGFLDILLIGLIIFFAVKLLRRRGAASGNAVPGQGGQGGQGGQNAGQGGWQSPPPVTPPTDAPPTDARSRAAESWDALRSQPGSAGAGGFGAASAAAPGQAAEASGTQAQPTVPPGFNVPEFLEGAKTVYARLQHSWDRRDLADIALFTTPEVLAEIRRQAEADPKPSKTELLLINARLLEFREEDRDTVLSVYFDVLLREDAAEERPTQVREVWHFSRPTANLDANWRLEGIQQLEA